MDNHHAFGEWAVVELLGKEGETFEDVVKRISKEALPSYTSLPGWSFVRLNLDTIRRETEPQEPAAIAPARYHWKDPEVKNTIRKPRKPRVKVSRETSRSVSVVEPKMEDVPAPEVVAIEKSTVMSRKEEIALFTKRQEERAMQILLGKE